MKYHVLVMMLKTSRMGRLMKPQMPTPDVPALDGRRLTEPDKRRLPGGGGFSIGSDSCVDDDREGPELVGWGAEGAELAGPEKICSTARWRSAHRLFFGPGGQILTCTSHPFSRRIRSSRCLAAAVSLAVTAHSCSSASC